MMGIIIKGTYIIYSPLDPNVTMLVTASAVPSEVVSWVWPEVSVDESEISKRRGGTDKGVVMLNRIM